MDPAPHRIKVDLFEEIERLQLSGINLAKLKGSKCWKAYIDWNKRKRSTSESGTPPAVTNSSLNWPFITPKRMQQKVSFQSK